jgi:hypothetical protein
MKENMVGEICGTHGRGKEIVQGFDGKVRREDTTWKIKAYMGRWDQNGSQGDWLRKCRVDPVGTG